MQSEDDVNVKTGDSRTMHARTTLARILKDSAFVTVLPVAQRLSPCALAMAALAGLPLTLSASVSVSSGAKLLHRTLLFQQ